MSIPFGKAYAPNVVLIVLTLFPGLINAGAMDALTLDVARSLAAAPQFVAAIPLISEGAFAFGILLAAECVRRRNLRPLYLGLLLADTAASALCASAGNGALFGASYVVQGLLSGMFLIVALPPLFMNFPESKFPISGAVLVPGLFGATMGGPLIAGFLAGGQHWRLLFAGDAVLLGIAFLLALATVEKKDPPAPETPIDYAALVLGAASMVLIFAGAINVSTHDWTYLPAAVPFAAGALMLAAMLLVEWSRKQPLIPIREMLTALPIVGLIAAGAGNAVFIADQRIFALVLSHVQQRPPLQAGLAVWPEIVTSLLAGVAFALAVKTRLLPRMILAGLVLSLAGSALLFEAVSSHESRSAFLFAAVVCFSLGAGLTVTPGLFLAGLSVEQKLVARGIAAVELLRLTFGFITGPGSQHTMLIHGANEKALALFVLTGNAVGMPRAAAVAELLAGMRWTLAYVLGGCLAAIIVTVAMLRIYYSKPEPPNLRAYVREGKPAYASPPLQT